MTGKISYQLLRILVNLIKVLITTNLLLADIVFFGESLPENFFTASSQVIRPLLPLH